MPYVRHGLEEVYDKPMSRMAHAATRLDGLMRWGTELSPDTMVHLLQESCVNNWHGALCRWPFLDDCNNNMVLSYEHTFGLLDWWKEFIDKLIVPYLASRFQSVVIIPLHPEYDVFHGLITRWMPILSL